MSTGIEWTDETWNPTTGCDRVSPGCDNCYALGMAKRLKAMGSADYQTDGDPKTSGPGFGLAIHPHRLDQPLRWKKPRKVFVNSMSDLFHKDVPDEHLILVFAAMALSPQHTFQILTKRHARMRSLLTDECTCGSGHMAGIHFRSKMAWAMSKANPDRPAWAPDDAEQRVYSAAWPLQNVWLGVSVEDQKWANIRIPALLETPAAVRFLSCEPLLGPVSLFDNSRIDTGTTVDWVIVGGESGPGARPMSITWARQLRDECTTYGIPFLFKQWGAFVHHTPTALPVRVGKHAAGRELDGRTWDEYPTEVPA